MIRDTLSGCQRLIRLNDVGKVYGVPCTERSFPIWHLATLNKSTPVERMLMSGRCVIRFHRPDL